MKQRVIAVYVLFTLLSLFIPNVLHAQVILVGDSRSVNIDRWANDGSMVVIAENGKGYKWFVDTAIGRVNGVKQKGDTIIIWLGVNDYRAVSVSSRPWETYASKINALAKGVWKDCTVYVASVGYVDMHLIKSHYNKLNRSNAMYIGGSVKVNGIADYNKKLRASLSSNVKWIDLESTIGIPANDKGTDETIWYYRASTGKYDGLHYGKSYTKKIFKYLLSSVSGHNTGDGDKTESGTDPSESTNSKVDIIIRNDNVAIELKDGGVDDNYVVVEEVVVE